MAQQIIITKDNYGIELECCFVDAKKKVLDITGCSVEVAIMNPSGEQVELDQAVVKSDNIGFCSYVLQSKHTADEGLYTSIWTVTDENGYVTAQENVYYFVKERLQSSDTNTGTIDTDELEDKIKELEDEINNTKLILDQIKKVNSSAEIVGARGNFPLLENRLDSIDININNINSLQQELNNKFNEQETEIDNKFNEQETKIDNKFNEQQTKIDNTLKKIDKFSEIHYINSIADEMSILIKCMNGETVLIDCGETFSANKIKNRLDALNVTEINHFIITHFHSDHAGSYDMILTNFNVDNVYYKPITWAMSQKEIGWNTPTIYNGFVAKVEQLGIQSYSLTEDKTITINEYEKIKLMNTSPYPYTNKSATTNYDVYDYNYESLMCYYTNGTTKVLFQADCPSNVAYSNYRDTIKNVDHLQVTHHGGGDNLKKEWTQSIKAKTGFYANTKFNTVEHYKAYTMTKLYSYDFDTSNSGCILVTSGSLTPTVTMVEKTLGDRFIDMGDDLWVYVDRSGNLVENGFVENNGKKYIMKNWYLALPSADGWYYGIENQAYALNNGGSVKCNQWVKTNGYNYYVDDRGVFIKNGIYKVGTTDVTFDEQGHANI